MKTVFLEAKSKTDVFPALEKSLRYLPEKIGILTTAQHMHKLKDVKKFLEEKGKKIFLGGQIIGCNASNAVKIKDKVDAFLYVGSGNFHPIEAALETEKKVVKADPLSGKAEVLKKEEVDKIRKRQKGALIKFLSSEKIGILVSTKPGQENMKKAFELKKNLKEKEVYIFVADDLNMGQLENFPFIESWINTACPRLVEDKIGVINYEAAEKAVEKA
ncbi:hypothetical protein GF336_03420 [Candidatus Woesearchaeota archaeon]|nr:hypothetical protein [Candidatus Woesearchaeota archaeon]